MNDKCAAGTGRGMEVIADLLSLPIEELGDISLTVLEDPPPVNCTCVIFAKSEALSLLRKVCETRRVIGFDVVELAPIPGQHVSDFLAARLVYKLICYMEASRK